jgi:hypothetical protein
VQNLPSPGGNIYHANPVKPGNSRRFHTGRRGKIHNYQGMNPRQQTGPRLAQDSSGQNALGSQNDADP